MPPRRTRREPEPTAIEVDWPAGPAYWEVVGSEGVRAWVGYKLYAADWYLSRLDSLFDGLDVVDHQLGIEMALDGALHALCSAVDAAAGGVIQAAELDNPPLRPTEPHDYDLRLAATRLRQAGRLRAARTIDAARVDPRAESPTGWLTQLQRLRAVAVQQSALVPLGRSAEGSAGQMRLEVPGLGKADPRDYLSEVRTKVEAFVKLLLAEVDRLTPRGAIIETANQVDSVATEPPRRSGRGTSRVVGAS
jgi:hypothetical protein